MLRLSIDGKPEPAGSKTAYPRGGKCIVVDANNKAKDWKKAVATQVKEQLPESFSLLDGDIIIACTFFLERPKGHFKKDGTLSAEGRRRPRPSVRPDVLKLMRGTEDALTDVVWTDDARVVDMHISKHYCSDGDTNGAEIAVMPADEYAATIRFEQVDWKDRVRES